MSNIYTIGHSQHSTGKFISLLKKYQITNLLDIRSVPYSKFVPQFNKENLKAELNRVNIIYSSMGNYFGARVDDKSLYSDEGYLDFEKVASSAKFKRAIDNVILGIEKGNRICLMCKEKKPIECHRSILISRAFHDRGINVNHILEDNSYEMQEDIELKLLDHYYPDRDQISLFDFLSPDESEFEYLNSAYQKRNKEIGYRIAEDRIKVVESL